MVYKGRKRRAFQDVGGLCSLGRWPPERRPVCRHHRVQRLRAAIRRELQDWRLSEGVNLEQVFMGMCDKDSTTCPFPEPRTARLLAYAFSLYGNQANPRADDRSSPVRVRLLQSILTMRATPTTGDWRPSAEGSRSASAHACLGRWRHTPGKGSGRSKAKKTAQRG